ncbi:uncharacterized protein LOC106164674 [Lingula anatina]|uniref:Uncharacterized protein LOC106164674 n=1 Tax=Lingula anatina TaxID=7574 RepID=A0A1S3IJQ0_LINAN|nr:uncharacterized protein LOC106164674 [Lingula anatina]|eukprot:XP_013398111.1 uncharacterized protein LOC106164674 [Lingula anatina]
MDGSANRASLSPGVVSRDSCYDSDWSPPGSRRGSVEGVTPSSKGNRTVAADFPSTGKDVARCGDHRWSSDLPELQHREAPVMDFDSSSTLLTKPAGAVGDNVQAPNRSPPSSQDYMGRLEYVIKLGYTEDKMRTVLSRVGNDVSNDVLLSELIKLGSCQGVPKDEEEEEEYLDSYQESDRLDSGHLPSKDDPNGGLPPGLLNDPDNTSNLRPIVVDGSNVAMSHGNKEVFSCRGIQLVVDWFHERGHQDITVFVPQWRKESSRHMSPIEDQEILIQLEKEKVLVFTPARRIQGKRVVCYDDRYVIKLAAETDAIVVSNDNYRDLLNENPEFKKVIEERLLMYSFVNDRFMPPDDPLGRHGPSLENFLLKEPTQPEPLPPPCPYGKRCTYGNKCKYYHPERGLQPQKSVTEKLAEQAKVKFQEVKDRSTKSKEHQQDVPPKRPPKPKTSASPGGSKTQLQRTKSLSAEQAALATQSKPQELNSPVPPPRPPKSYKETLEGNEEDRHFKSPFEVNDRQMISLKKKEDYNDLLDKHRRKVEEAEAIERANREKHKITLDEPPKAEETTFKALAPYAHTSLQPSLSDPHRLLDDGGQGHLSLAKKLSDEGDQMRRLRARGQSPGQSPLVDDARNASPPVPPSRPSKASPGHRKLDRQYSLAGANDPRVQQQNVTYLSQPLQSSLYQDRPPQNIHYSIGPDNTDEYRIQSLPGMSVSHLSAEMALQINDNMNSRSLSRMPSAPDTSPNTLSTVAQSLNRQNSASDTQLNSLVGEVDKIKLKTRGTMDYPYRDQNAQGVWPGTNMYGNQLRPGIPQAAHQGYLPPPPLSGYPQQGHHPGFTQQGQHMGFTQQGQHPGYPQQGSQQPGFTQQTQQPGSILTQSGFVDSRMCIPPPQPNEPCMPPTYYSYPPPPPSHYAAPLHRVESFPGAATSYQYHPPPPLPPRQHIQPHVTLSPPGRQEAGHIPISPSDPRFTLYFHLSGLFPAEKVLAVMEQFPMETNAQKLCEHLVKM